MPAYKYTCKHCGSDETRIAGIDDHTVTCDRCGKPMSRHMDLKSLLDSYKRPQTDN
jgi:putative FmdB family regulatory protein